MRAKPYVRVGTPFRFDGLARKRILGVAVPVASTMRSRLLGLALLRRERAGDGLLIPRCRSVHTFGMRFAVDLYFLDAGGAPSSIRRGVPPNRVVSDRRAVAVLEVPSPRGPRGGEVERPSP
jgi:hypothetical protein